MGLTDLFSDIYSAFTFTDVQAEAPDTSDDHKDGSEEGSSKSDEQTEEGKDGGEESTADDEGSEGGAEEGHHGDEGEDGGSGDGDAVEEEKEEEEEEEEPVDIKPKLEEGMLAIYCHHYISTPWRYEEAIGSPRLTSTL